MKCFFLNVIFFSPQKKNFVYSWNKLNHQCLIRNHLILFPFQIVCEPLKQFQQSYPAKEGLWSKLKENINLLQQFWEK